MFACARPFRLILLPALILLSFDLDAQSGDGVSLYTPYTKISVPPGESVNYSIEVKNSGSEMKRVDLAVTGLPRGWNATLKAGGYIIRQISVLPGEKRTVSLEVEVPLKVNKGNHTFRVIAGNYAVLPLIVNVSEQGTFKTEFTCDQINMEGHSKSNFNFSAKLENRTGETQMYSLRTAAPRGWKVIFKPNYKQATAVEVEPGNMVNISIEIQPPYNVGAGTYRIPVQAVNNSTSGALDLEVVITGTYEMELTTPTGLLSTDVTAGKEKRIELLVKNTGSAELENVLLRATKPRDWDVRFSPDTIPLIQAGENVQAFATIIAEDKAIPGDYVTTFTARTPEVSSSASFRVSVKTPLLWGWLGVIIILGTIAVIVYLFRKYGRR